MMNELLVLDDGQVQKARELARAIAREVQREIELHTTVSIERTAARLFGIDGVDGNGVPLPNVVVDQVFNGGQLERGVSFWLANAVVALDQTPQQIAEACARDLEICSLAPQDPEKVERVTADYVELALDSITKQRHKREADKERLGLDSEPLK